MKTTIRVGMSTCGLAAGAQTVFDTLQSAIRERQLPIVLQRTGCLGACHREPLVEVLHQGASTLYGPVRADQVGPLLSHYFGAEGQLDGAFVVSRQADRATIPSWVARSR